MKSRSFIYTLLLIVASQPTWADIPTCMNFQGVLRNNTGALVGGTHNLTFKIYDVATGGSPLWEETITGVRLVQGIFNVIMGDPTRTPFRPLTIAFDKPYWLGVSIDGGTELMQRIPMCPSPYALNSRRLYLPFAASVATTASGIIPAPILFDITQTGAGGAGRFAISNASNNRTVLEATTNGTGAAGLFINTHANAFSPALVGRTHSKADGTSSDGGTAGVLGVSRDDDSGAYSAGVLGINYGTSTRGGGEFPTQPPRAGVLGIVKRGGYGVMGVSASGYGVYGETQSAQGFAGYFVGRVFASGNVGIGTVLPNPANIASWSPVLTIGPSENNKAAIVELQGNNTFGSGGIGALVFRNTAAFSSQDNRLGQIQVNPDGAINAGSMRFESANNGVLSERMRITKDGNVGIGTTAPTRILQVMQNSSTDPIADAWTTYSSRRWKTNITTIPHALDKVQHLRGVYYDWKANGKHDIGLIAEEVGEVIPEVVQYEKNGKDTTSVDYARLVALLIEAIKEQQQEIAGLQDVVKSLVLAMPQAIGNVGGDE